MVQKEYIEKWVGEVVSDPYFIVDITVTPGNSIEVLVDGDQGISIQKCVEVSRHIEGNLDRETEDFALNVSSPGLGRPFKVYRQFVKNIGQKVEVTRSGSEPLTGILKNVSPDGFDLEFSIREKLEGSKRKTETLKVQHFLFSEEATVKNVISFK
jgi:ribosome maturation factor RimP